MSIVLTCYYRPKPGGFCKRLFRAIEALLNNGHDVHYVSVVPFPITHPRCYFHRFPWPQDKTDTLLFWGFFHALVPLLLLFHGFRQRITHLFVFGSTYGLLLQPLRVIKRIPLTLFLRGDPIVHHQLKGRSSWIIFIDTFLEGLSLQGVYMYGVSKTLSQRITKRHSLFKPIAVNTLPNEVPYLEHRPHRKPVLPLSLACVGTFEKEKNFDLIIRCMVDLSPQQAQLHLYGTGSDEDILRTLVEELGVMDRVTFMGWVDPISKIWENTDLLLFPSCYEGSPNAVLEALAYDVAVVASDIPEHREILPDCNLLAVDDALVWLRFLLNLIEYHVTTITSLKQKQSMKAKIFNFDWDANICSAILVD